MFLTSKRRLGRVLLEMHYRLRTEGDTAARSAGSVFLGTFIGCLPLYGAHLLLCAGLAKLLGLSRIKTYLAAYINNPFTAPLLLGLEFGVGHWLRTDRWPGWNVSQFRDTSLVALGGDLLAGSMVLGLAAGLLLGGLSLWIRLRWRATPLWEKLCEETARRYLGAGVAHWEFVRGKLRHDPVYREIVASGLLPGDGVLQDLGCGRGILLALIQASAEFHARGDWSPEWSPPPRNLVLQGVERRPSLASIAEGATAGRARITVADLRGLALGPARAIVLLDVLHYLPAHEQERLIRRASEVLEPGGVILIREPDAARPVRFLMTRLGERLCCTLRGEWRSRLHYRGIAAWCGLLEEHGLTTATRPSWRRTPFANVLIRSSRPVAGSGHHPAAPCSAR